MRGFMRSILRTIVLVLVILVSACGSAPQPASTPLPGATNTPRPATTPRPTPTPTPTPYLGGDCDPNTERVVINTSVPMSVSGGTYPDTCEIYCLWVLAGSSLEIGISDFDVDLDIYVDTDLSVLEYGDRGEWRSNAYGTVDELVLIPEPGGRYYIQVCSYEALPSDFILYSTFTP